MAAQQDIPSNCELHAVIRFLNLETVSDVEIRSQLCAVYSADKVMSKWHAYKWITCFDKGRINEHNVPRNSRPSVE